MPKLNFAKDFVLTHDDGSKTPFKKGSQDVDDSLAAHWFVKGHVVGAKPNPGAGTPAFLRAAAEERARLEAEQAKIESDRDAAVTASVREKMEAEMAERIGIALEQQAQAAVNGVDAEVAKRVAAETAAMDARVDAIVAERVGKAVEDALLAHIEAEAKAAEAKNQADDVKKAGKAK